MAAFWFGSFRLGGISLVLLLCAIFAGLAFSDWEAPEPALPRRDRRRIAAERSRIHVEKAIADMEREAGLR